MSSANTPVTSTIHPVDRILPVRQMLTLGLQHMAVSYIGAIAVPLIVASALKMSQADTVVLISTTLFCSGIATLLQTVGFWKFGVRLPILQGVAFSSVGPVIAIGTNPQVGFAGVSRRGDRRGDFHHADGTLRGSTAALLSTGGHRLHRHRDRLAVVPDCL